MNFTRVARRYVELGFYVIPVVPHKRNPLCARGELDATCDIAVIEAWGRQFPDADVAIVPGLSERFVLDVDVRHEGDLTLAALPPLPDTPTTLTGGGGFHHWFERVPELRDLRLSGLRVDGLDKSGIDIKGLQSGYVVVPPSRHPLGRRYTWEAVLRIDEVEIAKPPPWLVQRLLNQGTRKRNYSGPRHQQSVDPTSFLLGRLFKGRGWLGREVTPGIFAVRCPTEDQHSTGTAFDGSTKIFAPTPGRNTDQRGHFYCHHNSYCTEQWR